VCAMPTIEAENNIKDNDNNDDYLGVEDTIMIDRLINWRSADNDNDNDNGDDELDDKDDDNEEEKK
jgi:hypothetical protein